MLIGADNSYIYIVDSRMGELLCYPFKRYLPNKSPYGPSLCHSAADIYAFRFSLHASWCPNFFFFFPSPKLSEFQHEILEINGLQINKLH